MITRILSCFALVCAVAAALALPGRTHAAERICFAEVPDCIDGRFAEYWRENGGLAVFGFPKSPAMMQHVEGKDILVQQFERNRFELHPENARPYDVLLGRLGDDLLKRQGRDWFAFPKVGGAPANCLFFAETGHSLCDPFLKYYRANGLEFDGKVGKSLQESLALFGLPLSEPQVETLADGRSYTVQWFERARFELHPENAAPYDVLLGLLGNEVLASPAPQPPAEPGQMPLPEPQYAVADPERGPSGTQFFFAAAGFEPGERIGVYITLPDQSVFGAPFQVEADDEGFSEIVTFTVPNDPEVPTGVWAITFEGTSSGHKGIAYFEVTP